MTHTPGPWKVNYYPQNQQEIADHTITADKKVIAFCPTGYPLANARLIAAAPALLEALKNLLEDRHTLEFWLDGEQALAQAIGK